METARHRVLKHFNTSSATHTVVFTAGATASLKLVADCFKFKPDTASARSAWASSETIEGSQDLIRTAREPALLELSDDADDGGRGDGGGTPPPPPLPFEEAPTETPSSSHDDSDDGAPPPPPPLPTEESPTKPGGGFAGPVDAHPDAGPPLPAHDPPASPQRNIPGRSASQHHHGEEAPPDRPDESPRCDEAPATAVGSCRCVRACVRAIFPSFHCWPCRTARRYPHHVP